MTTQQKLAITHIPISDVAPNPWNPNKQTERQFDAEVESILANGFVAPILVRANKGSDGSTHQVIDGEHRLKALSRIIAGQMVGSVNVPDLVATRTIPAIVIKATDAQAKKLTVVMNETRGSADTAQLSALLADLSTEFGSDLLTGLPYTQEKLDDLLSMGSYDWDQIAASYQENPAKPHDWVGGHAQGEGEQEFPPDDEGEGKRVLIVMDEDTWDMWIAAVENKLGTKEYDPQGAAAVLRSLLETHSQHGVWQ